MMNILNRLSNLQQRILVAIPGMLLFAGLIWWGWQGAVGLFMLLLVLCLYEFYGLSPLRIPVGWKMVATLLGLLAFGIILLANHSGTTGAFTLFYLYPALLFVPAVFSHNPYPFERIAWLVTGWFYLIPCWICMLLLVMDQAYHPGVLFGLFGLLWAADSGAYFAGRKWGRTKLLPRVSPKKSWEGLAGGLLASALLAVLLHRVLDSAFSFSQWLVLAGSTTIFGTLGDLAESALKRSLGVKDSGNLLPGHGGILDRFDGLFLAAPLNYLILRIIFGYGI
jgi:phosphatidate cytidylyltransferase